MIRAYGVLNDIDRVWQAWREMKERRIPPTCVTMGCMVEDVTNNGDAEAGLALIHEALADEETCPLVNAAIYCSVLKGFPHSKRYDRAWAVHEEMRKSKIKFSIVTYTALVDACARSGEMNRVQRLLGEMSQASIEPNVITYSAVPKG